MNTYTSEEACANRAFILEVDDLYDDRDDKIPEGEPEGCCSGCMSCLGLSWVDFM